MPDPQTLAQLVRAKYPGVYDSLSDEDLESKVRAKYPGVYDAVPSSKAKKPEPTTLQKIGGSLTSMLPIAEGTVGAIVGAGAGAPAGPPGAFAGGVTGALLGGGSGEAHRQLINRWLGLPSPSTPQAAAAQIASAGTTQAEGEAGGTVVKAGLRAAAPAVRTALSGILRNPNQVEAAATTFGQSRGIPVDLGTATGSKVVRGVQHIADSSLGGGLVERGAAARTATNLTRVGEDLAAEAHPVPVSPYEAGQGVRVGIETAKEGFATQANQAYDALRKMEAATPMTADISKAQTALKPIYDRMLRLMPVAQQQANPALHAIKNILDSPSTLSASMADEALGAIKGIVRNESNTALSRGMAQRAVDQLSAAVDAAVAQGGPKAIAALKAGRSATVAKYGASDVLDRLTAEPVQVFKQAIWKGDAGIDKLSQIQKLAPDSLPKLGRAYLDDLLETATKEGGFDRAAALARNWQQLGPKTKALLFPDAQLVKNLDNFFLLAKKLGTNVNPSGSGTLVTQGGHMVYLATNPLTGIPMQIGGAALSSLMHDPKAVALLTQGMRTPRLPTVAARGWAENFGQLIAGMSNPQSDTQGAP